MVAPERLEADRSHPGNLASSTTVPERFDSLRSVSVISTATIRAFSMLAPLSLAPLRLA